MPGTSSARGALGTFAPLQGPMAVKMTHRSEAMDNIDPGLDVDIVLGMIIGSMGLRVRVIE